jgi:hypothetical protein
MAGNLLPLVFTSFLMAQPLQLGGGILLSVGFTYIK